MRHIDISQLSGILSPEWEEKARVAYAKVKKPPHGMTRAEMLKSCSSVWSEVKGLLKQLSHGKCWYCESPAHRIIGDVDHFRPKGQAKHYPPDEGVGDREGYWRFAFEPRNFRYSCEMCNRRHTDPVTGIVGGKGSYFPLVDPKKRINWECDYDDLIVEDPVLLDPTVVEDPPLLTFNRYGKVQPACDPHDHPIEYRRAKISIELYHLNHTDLQKTRKTEVCDRIVGLVRKMDNYSSRWERDRNDVDALIQVREATTAIKKMIHERAPYSAAAIATLLSFRSSKRKWINTILIS